MDQPPTPPSRSPANHAIHDDVLQTVVETVPLRVFWKDRECRYLGCNTAFAKDAGFSSPAELIGKDDFSMAWRDQAELYRADDFKVMESGQAKVRYEEPQTGPNGEAIWLRTSKVPLRNANGDIIGMVGTYENITAEKQMESALVESASHLRMAQRIAQVGSWHLDLASGDVNWSPVMYEMFGLNPENGTPDYGQFRDILTADSWTRMDAAVRECVDHAQGYELELELNEKTDATGWLLVRGEAVVDAQRKVIGLTGTAANITQRKRSEIELEKRTRDLVEAQRIANIGNWSLDIPTGQLYWSDEIYRIFDLDAATFTATYEGFLKAIHPDDREQVGLAYTESLRNRTPYNITHRLIMPDGRVKYVREKCETQYDESGKPLRSIGTIQDITERHTAAIELLNANQALRVLSACNEIIFRATSESAMLQDVCDMIVETGRYKMAWIGMVRHDPEKSIDPVAIAGHNDGYVAKGRFSWALDRIEGRGLSGMAVRSGKTQVNQSYRNSIQLAHLRGAATQRGYQSSIGLPLKHNDKVIGVLTIYADEEDAFSQEEVTLLESLASDISFGIQALQVRGERDRIEQEREQKQAEMLQSLEDFVKAISSTMAARDPYTAGHQKRATALAVAIAREMGLPEDSVHGLEMAAAVHDIGQVNVPTEILTRPGKLSRVEFQLIKSHPDIGHDILKDIRFPWPLADIVYQHHERLDGSGYPQGLKGDQIIREARILTVADVAEAMSSHRPYRPAHSPEAVVAELQGGRGVKYDPEAVDACLRLLQSGRFTFPPAN